MEEKNIEIKVGMQLLYAEQKVTVKEVNKTHVLVSFWNGKTIAVNKLGFSREHLIK